MDRKDLRKYVLLLVITPKHQRVSIFDLFNIVLQLKNSETRSLRILNVVITNDKWFILRHW